MRSKPVTLNLKLDYAVCEKLCVPAEAKLELMLTGAETANEAALNAAEARVPKPAAVGDGGTPSIRAVRREAGSGKPRVMVDVAAPAGAPVVLFAEGPTAQWALPLPEPVAGAPAGLQRFAFELDGLPPGEQASTAPRFGSRRSPATRPLRSDFGSTNSPETLEFTMIFGFPPPKPVPAFRDHALV